MHKAGEIATIGSVMTPFALAVAIDQPLRIAEDMMIDNEVRHLAVTDTDSLVGVISDRDIAFTANSPETGLRDRLRVRDVCSLDLYAVEVSEPLERVLTEMAERHIGSVIITENDKISGIFTATDACRCFAQFLRAS